MKNGTCHIVGAGDFSISPVKEEGDVIIAADGGFEHLKKAGITPDMCVGDFDSLGYVPEGVKTVKLPVCKDDTDMIAAAKEGIKLGFERFKFYGVLGGRRFSHSMAAVQTLFFLSKKGFFAEIAAKNMKIFAITKKSVCFSGEGGDDVSFFSLSDVSLVTLKGFKYELEDYRLQNSFPLGVSNSFTGKKAEITVKEGTVLAVFEKKG